MDELSPRSGLARRVVTGWSWATAKVVSFAAVVGSTTAIVATCTAHTTFITRVSSRKKGKSNPENSFLRDRDHEVMMRVR